MVVANVSLMARVVWYMYNFEGGKNTETVRVLCLDLVKMAILNTVVLWVQPFNM